MELCLVEIQAMPPLREISYRNNVIQDVYSVAIYLSRTDQTLILDNDISRAGKTSVGNFYGIFFSHENKNSRVERNYIHNTNDLALSSTATASGINL